MMESLFPHMSNPRMIQELMDCTIDTVVMVLVSALVSFIFGLALGVVLTLTKPDGLHPNKVVFNFLDKAINVLRSIPFLILIMILIPATRLIMGTSIGVQGAIFPLIIGTIPFYARQIESVLSEVDHGLIEASEAMGCTTSQIIIHVMLHESIPSIIRVSMITLVNLIGLTAMAGAVGAGGLGDFAIRYGYQNYQTDSLWISLAMILLLVSIVQCVGGILVKKTTH